MSSTQANEQPVLVVYDIRGIQDFVFRTNRVRDIVGASAIVADVLENSIREWFEQKKNPAEFVFEWYDKAANDAKNFSFIDQVNVQQRCFTLAAATPMRPTAAMTWPWKPANGSRGKSSGTPTPALPPPAST